VQLRAHGLAVRVPRAWDARVYRRDPEEQDERTFPIVHAGTFALPRDRGDYGSGAVDVMGPDDVFVCLLEQDPEAVGTALFRPKGMPRIKASDFGAGALQRTLTGQSGAQYFFSTERRAFVLYVVLGSHARRVRLVPKARELVAGLGIS
jgi:hypothetical protein